MNKDYPPIVITLESLPKPTGPYKVGTSKFLLNDPDRKELYYPNGRLIPIQIYFPTTKGIHELSPKILEENSPQIFSQIFYYVYSLKTDISKLANGRHPIVFLNQGLTAAMTDYSLIAEDLASHGYIVITIQHQLRTDHAIEPESWKNYSFSLHARIIENILFVFEWIKSNKNNLFDNNIDINKVGFIGHSLGGNAILLLANRISGNVKGYIKRTLLPREDKNENVSECLIVLDFDHSFAYPQHDMYPILFIVSEQRKNMLQDSGIFEDMQKNGHQIQYYMSSKHISFFDQGYIEPKDPCFPQLSYFDGTPEERINFFDDLRNNIRKYLIENSIFFQHYLDVK